jgi:hypothetical protein
MAATRDRDSSIRGERPGLRLEVLAVSRRPLSTFVVILAAVGGMVAGTSVIAPPATATTTATGSPVLWGMVDGDTFDSAEADLGRPFALAREYRRMDQSFVGSRMQSLVSSGHALVVSVKSKTATTAIPYTDITAGKYDQTFLAGFDQIEALPLPTYFIFQHEVDSSAAKASCSSSATTDAACGPEFIAAWRHVYDLAHSHGYTKPVFTWTITNYGFNPQTGVRNNHYWPGADYTDWLGVDAYNGGCQGTWYGTFEETLASTVEWAKTHAPNMPIMIPELGATEGSTANAKPDFFRNMPATLAKPGYSNIKAIMYWNAKESGCDFTIDSSPSTFDAFRTVGLDPVMSAKPGDPVILGTPTPTPDPEPTPDPTPSPDPTPAQPTGSTFHPLTPSRVLDTRTHLGASGAVGAYKTITLTVPTSKVPANATAVAMNVTVTEPRYRGHLTVFPGGTTLPLASNLNFNAGQTIPNMVIAKLGSGGRISFNNSSPGSVHVLADVAGYYTKDSTGAPFHPTSPTRVMDTRYGIGVAGAVGAGRTVTLTLPISKVPTNATAVALNVTVTQPRYGGHLTVFPGGTALPTASNLNYWGGQTIANMVVAKVGSGGRISFNNSARGSVHVIADLAGYYASGDSGVPFNPTSPARLMDTRIRLGVGAAVGPGRTVTLTLPSSQVPAGATAVALNVTVTQPKAGGHSIVFPGGTSLPTTSNLNFVTGQTIPNMVIAKVGPGGRVSFNNSATGTVQLVADLAGYFTE